MIGLNIFFVLTVVFDFVFCEDSASVCVFNQIVNYLASLSKVSQHVLLVFVHKRLLQVQNLFHVLDENLILSEDQVVAKKAIQKGQQIFKIFSFLTAVTAGSRVVGFIFTLGQVPIIPLWFPFEEYVVIKAPYHFIALSLLSLQAIASGMFPPICFVLLNAHLKILSQQLLRVGAGDREPHTELNLATIVERHNIILK